MNYFSAVFYMVFEDEYEAFIALVYVMEIFKWRYLYLDQTPKLRNLIKSL